MHERVLELRALGGNEAHGFELVLLAHGGLEVGGGLGMEVGLALAPGDEETVGPAQPSQDSEAVGGAHPAVIVVQRDIQAQVESGFDAPALPVGPRPLPGRRVFRAGNWWFFGADEPSYATIRHGSKLIGELGTLAPPTRVLSRPQPADLR